MEAGGSVGNSRDLPVARKASPSTKKNHKSRDHYNDSNREIDKEHLAKLLRASADIVEKGEFASVLYEALQDFRVYYKQNYPKNHKKKKHSSKHGQQSLVRENSGNSHLTAGSEKTNSESSEILKDLKHSEENAPKSAHAAHHVDTKEDAESDTLHGNKANASHDAESPEETGANPDKDDGDTAGANHSASRHEQMKPEVSAPFDEEKVAEKKQPSPEESETTEEDEKPGGTERASVASVVPPSPYFARKLAKPIQVEKKDTVPEHYVVASGAAAAASPTHQSNNRAFGKKFNLGATFKNVKKAAMNVTENISEKIPGKAHHHNKPAEDLGIFSESGIAMAESSGRRRSEGVGNDEFGNAEFQSRVTGGEAGVTASAGHNASEQKNDKNSYQQFSHEVGSKSAPPKPPLSRTGPALFESQRFVEQSPPKQFESTPEDRSGKSIGSHDCSESDGIRGGFETSPAVPDRIMELGGGGLMSKPSFQRPANKESALVANGWIEQFRRSKMRHVWKEVLASLVEGRKPGEVTTLWIQREVADPITGQKKLEALHRIPLKMLEDVSLTEHSTDNQFRLKLFNGTEDFVFRCSDAPIDAMRWVQMLKQHEQLAKGTIKNATNGYHKESNVPVQQQRSPTTKGMAIRDLRAICHGAGINTAGMERAQLEAAAAEVQSRGTYFDQRGAPTAPSAPSPARYPTQQEKQQHQPSHYPQPVQADHSNDHARNAPASSAEYPQQQQEQQQAEPKRLAIKDLRAICHGAGINTAGMERRELEAAAREVESRGTYFPSTIAGTPAPSEEETRARQEEYRRQQLQQQEELRRRQESDAALKRHQQEVEESRRRAAEMEARRQEEARRRAMEEEQRRRAAEEEARRRAAADEARRRAAAEEQARRQREAHVAQERYAQQQAAWQQQQQAEQQRRHHAEQQAAQERRRREEAMRKEQQWAAAAPGAHPQQQWQQQHQQQYQAYSQQQQQHPPQQRWQQQQQQQQQQPFPFASDVIPEPSFDIPVRQDQLAEEDYQTELYMEEGLPDLAYPQYAEPEVIANPYDFTPFRDEQDRVIDIATPVPQSPAGAITLATDPIVSPAVEVKNIWETDAPQTIQGASLKTWDFNSERLEAVQVLLKTEGRPLKADIELWQGENAPQKISVYSENGDTRPLSAFIATPYNGHTAIAVKNSGEGEFPMKACVEADMYQNGNHLDGSGQGYGNQLAKFTLQQLWDRARPKTVQGDGATYVVPLESNIQRVQILITSEKNPINARIEILEGPNNVKQVMEISTEDGKARPFFCVLELPDPILTNVMRVVNTGPFEFPIECRIEPFKVEDTLNIDEENLYFLMDSGPSADQTSNNSPFLLS